jgi:hypothetical protein
MTNRSATKNRTETPSPDEFLGWSSEKVSAFTQDMTILLSTSGTSRWYFLEHGDTSRGYDEPELFETYGRLVIERVMDIAGFIFNDGVQTLLITGFAGGQGTRNEEYLANMRWVYRLLADDTTAQYYAQHQIGVKFRGDWPGLLNSLQAEDLSVDFQKIEQSTGEHLQRQLIWYVRDDYIPHSLAEVVQEALTNGQLPDHQALVTAYYGRPIRQIDILIGNNKPSLPGVMPPLLPVRDLYFTVSPITYLQHRTWRRILYDHLFARRGHFRNFKAMTGEETAEMKQFYTENQEEILGLGRYHAPSQSWRPSPWFDSADPES